MTSTQTIMIICLIAVNSFAYLLMCYDKLQSKKKAARISERFLFLTAFVLGAPGVYAGMQFPLYHKASKKYFRVGVPVLMLLNALTVFLFCRLFKLIW